MKRDVAASAPLPTSSRSDLPPLRVHHFIAWTTATALLISGSLAFDRWAPNGPPTEDPFVIVSLLLVAIGVSGTLAATGWGLVWRARGRAFTV